jgi:hypothetical protein
VKVRRPRGDVSPAEPAQRRAGRWAPVKKRTDQTTMILTMRARRSRDRARPSEGSFCIDDVWVPATEMVETRRLELLTLSLQRRCSSS